MLLFSQLLSPHPLGLMPSRASNFPDHGFPRPRGLFAVIPWVLPITWPNPKFSGAVVECTAVYRSLRSRLITSFLCWWLASLAWLRTFSLNAENTMFLRSLLFLWEGTFFGGGRRGETTIVPKERVMTLKNPRRMQKTLCFYVHFCFWGRGCFLGEGGAVW